MMMMTMMMTMTMTMIIVMMIINSHNHMLVSITQDALYFHISSTKFIYRVIF